MNGFTKQQAGFFGHIMTREIWIVNRWVQFEQKKERSSGFSVKVNISMQED